MARESDSYASERVALALRSSLPAMNPTSPFSAPFGPADRFIVQRLTDMVYIGYDSTCHYDQIHKVARLFTVIRDSLADLANYYREVNAIIQEPGRKYFCRQHKKLFALRYIRAIDDTACCNLAYVAETDDQREVLIKFFDRYGSHEDSELQARLIDFDWSGMEGEVFYPAGLSTNAGWTEGAASFKEIKKVHDRVMLKEHFAN
ncbi:hypothetical protein PQX77_022106 [Marasmius sp. AFHP31]|nr:hypothetical protein PQX77_022106 [Marasmius sp. AFHP31]